MLEDWGLIAPDTFRFEYPFIVAMQHGPLQIPEPSSPRPYHTTVPNVLSSRMGHIHNALSLVKHGLPTTGNRFVKRAACHDGNMRQALAVLINESPMDLWPSYFFYLIGYSRGWGLLKMNSKRTCHLKSQFKGKYSL